MKMNSERGTWDAELGRSGEADNFLARTKAFGLREIRLVQSFPADKVSSVIGHQLLRSATSVGANDRAARRARSTAEFCSKLGIVAEEAQESGYWLELLTDSCLVKPALLADLRQESDEITALVVASIVTARGRKMKTA